MTTESMWAAVLRGPGEIVTTEVPRPPGNDIGAGQVLVRVEAGGICGSDGPYLRGAPSRFDIAPAHGFWGPPGFPMHEIAGEVITSKHPKVRVGERVVGWADRFDGASEVVVTDGESVMAYDSSLSPADAVLLQPLACVLHAAGRLGEVRGKRCAVLGVGPIGALFTHVLAHGDAASVVAVDRVDRTDVTGALHASSVVTSDAARWATTIADDERPEVVIEAVGHQVATLQHAVDAVAPGGSVFYFGVPDSDIYPLDMEKMVRKHLTLMAGGTVERRSALRHADAYLRRFPDLVSALVTHRFVREQIQQAYDCALRPARGRLKVVVMIG